MQLLKKMELEASPLLDLYDAVLNLTNNIVNKDDLKRSSKMEAIDLFLQARAHLKNQNINLFRAIANYVTSPTDVDRHNDVICFLANLTPGSYCFACEQFGWLWFVCRKRL